MVCQDGEAFVVVVCLLGRILSHLSEHSAFHTPSIGGKGMRCVVLVQAKPLGRLYAVHTAVHALQGLQGSMADGIYTA
jgi:hypothetical protein